MQKKAGFDYGLYMLGNPFCFGYLLMDSQANSTHGQGAEGCSLAVATESDKVKPIKDGVPVSGLGRDGFWDQAALSG